MRSAAAKSAIVRTALLRVVSTYGSWASAPSPRISCAVPLVASAASKIARHAVAKRRLRIETALAAQRLEPAQTDRNMADLVVVDARQDGGALGITGAVEAPRHLRRHIEPARLQHQRHDREACDD